MRECTKHVVVSRRCEFQHVLNDVLLNAVAVSVVNMALEELLSLAGLAN